MTIKAICFDADGVVVNPQMQFSRYLLEVHKITYEMTQPFFNGVFNDCLIGRKDLKLVLPSYLTKWNWKRSVDDFVQIWLIKDHITDAKVINKIIQLCKKGFICCLATNQEYHRTEYMKTQMGFQSLFDYLFFSSEMGCQKPESRYYQQIEKILNLDPQSILFWDDNEQNVNAARERGWQAEVYTQYEDFNTKLDGYLAES